MNENLKEQAPQTEVIPVTEEKVEKKKKNKIAKRENNINGYFFVAPYAIVFAVFILIPLCWR